MIYLDYNATTPVAAQVLEAMLPYLRQHFANPASGHQLAEGPRAGVVRARRQVASFLGSQPAEVIFTSGGTESNNLALHGVAHHQGARGRRQIITSAVEHPAVMAVCGKLCQQGFSLDILPVDSQGLVDPASLERIIGTNTALVSVMHANNEVGTVQPVAELARIAHQHGALCHSDAAQSCGKIPCEVGALGVDLLSLAGHKLYAPKGVGALFVREGTPVEPLMAGAGQERGLRPGTENVAGIVALGQACELAQEQLTASKEAGQRALVERLWQGLNVRLDSQGLRRNGHPELCLPNTLSVSIAGTSAVELLSSLGGELAASAGAACKSSEESISPVLTAMGVPASWALGTLRLSVGCDTTDEEVDRAVGLIADAVKVARGKA